MSKKGPCTTTVKVLGGGKRTTHCYSRGTGRRQKGMYIVTAGESAVERERERIRIRR